MPYKAEISRNNPGCFLFVIDQSGSMVELLPNGKTKAKNVADTINRFFQNLIIKCAKSEGIRDYFYVGVIGYGQNDKVLSAFEGDLAGKELVPISEVAHHPLEIQEREQQIDDGRGNLLMQKIKLPIWFNPIADGHTPMKESFGLVNRVVSNWLNQNPNCFPPLIIHITDGASTDGDPSMEMKKLIGQSSIDGNVLLFNLHLSSGGSAEPIFFPSNTEGLPDEYAKMLFENSSILTSKMIALSKEEYSTDFPSNSRAFVFNGDISAIIKALEIGTRPSIDKNPDAL